MLMSSQQLELMRIGREKADEARRQQLAADWVAYRDFLRRDAEAVATTGRGLSWANVKIPRGAEHS
jgi:hypothetical protein